MEAARRRYMQSQKDLQAAKNEAKMKYAVAADKMAKLGIMGGTKKKRRAVASKKRSRAARSKTRSTTSRKSKLLHKFNRTLRSLM